MKGFIWFLLGVAAGLAIALVVDRTKPIVINETSSVNIVERQYDVAEFTGVKVGGAFNAVLNHGEPGVTVQVPEELLPYVKVECIDGILTVTTRGRVKVKASHSRFKAFITLPELHYIGVSGASNVLATDFTGSDVDVDASGASDLDMGGDVTRININASGAASVSFKGLAEFVTIEASGAADVFLMGEGALLRVKASGAADVDADEFGADSVSVDASGAAGVDYHEAVNESVKTRGSASVEKH
ncbi:MAG: DUF2807 domain-containing protein [Bacteroidales bacterium]|nr:DUF2807 domain-containing protein [Bacteroidales bacterium]